MPGSVRWIDAEHLSREFQGAGAIIAMAAPPSAWLTSWPGLPDLSSAHLVYVDETGRPTVDRGLTKRTYAAVQDAVVVLGCPLLDQPRQPVLHHHAALPVLGKGLALLQGAGLLENVPAPHQPMG